MPPCAPDPTFRCNVCGALNQSPPAGFTGEEPSCAQCRSNLRLRSMIRALSCELFGVPLALPDFPVMKSIRGLGMSDDQECAARLASRFDYRNTFYDREPRFDVSRPPAGAGPYDFVLAGGVFEHVAPPVEEAFANIRGLLAPHGFLLMTVPLSSAETTAEYFPEMHEYTLAAVGEHPVLVNRTRAGAWQIFDRLVFHGGVGATLELRLFGVEELRRTLSRAGFSRVAFVVEQDEGFGIQASEPWPVPIVAARDAFRLPAAAGRELIEQYCLLRADNRRLEAEVNLHAAETNRLAGALNLARHRLALWDVSRWARLGRALGFGPQPD